MTTTYSQTGINPIQAQSAIVRPKLVIDPGNRFTKWAVDGQVAQSIPSYVKLLEDWEDSGSDAQSYEIGFKGKRYIVGKLAQFMGGQPAFEVGKADLAHLLILPALAANCPQRIERLLIPTPDSRNQETISKLKQLETTIDFSVNGRDCLSTIRKIELVDECTGAFDLATHRLMWKFPTHMNGVLDVGGGTSIARLFAPGGNLLRDADILLPGTAHFAQALASAILPKMELSPDTGILMDSIASGSMRYGNTDIDFSREFSSVRNAWVSDIRLKLKTKWAKFFSNFGELLVIGGSASLLQPLCDNSKGRFKIAPKPQFFNLIGLAKETN